MFAGLFDPSLYLVLVNADEVGWVTRPPCLHGTETSDIIERLAGISSRVSRDEHLDFRFAASLHERKHFCDMHFSGVLWERFLRWFHCASNIFLLINNLRGKCVRLPLYNIFGDLRTDLPISDDERLNIARVCDPVFFVGYDMIMDYIFEASATLLQFGILPDRYSRSVSEDSSSYGQQYYETYFVRPLADFKGCFERAFAFYNFCSWFCRSKREIDNVHIKLLEESDIQIALFDLLTFEGFHEKKLLEIEADRRYLTHHSENFRPVSSSLVVDLPQMLSRMMSYRTEFFRDIHRIVSLLSDIRAHEKWLREEAPSVPFLVDFQRELKQEEEISVNYELSRWILPRSRFLYYHDHLGMQILTSFEVDMLTWVQHLCRFIIGPSMYMPFGSVFIDEGFLGFQFIDERSQSVEHRDHNEGQGLMWRLQMD